MASDWHLLTLLSLAASLGCNPTPRTTSPESNVGPDHLKPPIEGAKIIGIVLRLVGDGEEPPKAGVVYLEDAPRDPNEAMTATVSVEHKSFAPFITVVPSGGTVTFANKDALPHHVFSPDLQHWDTGILKTDETATRRFDAPGSISLLCNIHPEMLGYVLVIPSTHYGRIGTDGRYIVPNVHAGTYRITAWSPRLSPVTQSVTVGSIGAVTADFTLKQ
jgi:plastocyanin